MKLMTKEIKASLPAVYSTERVRAEEKMVVAKFFDPCGRGTWYVIEGEEVCGDCGDSKHGVTADCEYIEDYRLFTFCVSPLGSDCDEFGYVMLSELESVRNRFGLGIERDLHFTPKPIGEIPELRRVS